MNRQNIDKDRVVSEKMSYEVLLNDRAKIECIYIFFGFVRMI